MMKTYIVIPGYNEARYLATVLKDVSAYTKNVIFVDDGSRDETNSIARKYLKHVVTHDVNLGKGAAMKSGAEYAFAALGADSVIFMDADSQHSAKELPKFFAELKAGAEIVFGVRTFRSNVPLLRLVGNRFESILFNLLFKNYIPDIPSGFKAMSKSAYRKIIWSSPGYEVETEIAVRTVKHHIPYRVVEIDMIYHDADKGMTPLDAVHIGKKLVQWKIGL